MSWWYRRLIRPVLFAQDAEEIHRRTMRVLAWASRAELACDALESFFGAPELPITVFGLRFPNPIGLAAGMDKEAEAVPAWTALGFGFCELRAELSSLQAFPSVISRNRTPQDHRVGLINNQSDRTPVRYGFPDSRSHFLTSYGRD